MDGAYHGALVSTPLCSQRTTCPQNTGKALTIPCGDALMRTQVSAGVVCHPKRHGAARQFSIKMALYTPPRMPPNARRRPGVVVPRSLHVRSPGARCGLFDCSSTCSMSTRTGQVDGRGALRGSCGHPVDHFSCSIISRVQPALFPGGGNGGIILVADTPIPCAYDHDVGSVRSMVGAMI